MLLALHFLFNGDRMKLTKGYFNMKKILYLRPIKEKTLQLNFGNTMALSEIGNPTI